MPEPIGRRVNPPLIVAFAVFVVMAAPVGILNVAWEPMAGDFAQPFETLGVLLSMYTIGRLIGTFAAGRMIVRFGLFRVLAAGTLVSAIGLAGYVLSGAWPLMLASAFTLALGWGTVDISMNVYIAANHRPGIIAFLHASYGVGLTLGPIIAALFITALDGSWRLSYIVVLVGLLALLGWTVAIRTQWTLPRAELSEDGQTPVKAPGLWATLALPLMVGWIVFAFVYGGIEVGTGQLAGTLLTDSRGLDPATAGTWISVYWGIFTVGRVVIGVIGNRVRVHVVLIASMIVTLIGTVLLMLPGLNLALPGLLLIGAGLAAVFPSVVGSLPRWFGVNHAPNAIGFTIGVASAGTAVLPGIGAFVAARLGFESIGVFLVVLAVSLTALYAVNGFRMFARAHRASV
ncbi:MAG: MFS transporter [Chloroflexi bacterium]|nr:MFS transporter [Chloroflexota bacterium]